MNLWLPNTMNYAAYRVDRAVHDYDERLLFARNEDTGDWCVFIRMPAPRPPYPVLGFGDSIPDPNEALHRLKASDTMIHGEQIYKDVMRSQKAYKDGLEYASDQAAGDVAERAEHLMRSRGDSPVIKVFMNNTEGVVSSDS